MAQRKGTGRGRRRQAAKAPVIDLEASEVAEEPETPAEGEAATNQSETPDAADEKDEVAAESAYEDATEAETSDPEPSSEAAAEEPKGKGRGKLIAAGIAALLLTGAAGGAWLYRDVGANYFPSAASERQAAQLAALETRIASLEAANANVSTALGKLTSQIESLTSQLQTTSQATAAQGEQAGQTASKADAANALAEKAGEQAAQAAAAIEGTKAAADKALGLAESASQRTEGIASDLKTAQAGIGELKAAIAAAAESASSLTGDASESVKAAQAQISGLTLKLSEVERKLEDALAKPQADPALAERVGTLATDVAALKTNLADALKSQQSNAAQAGKLAERDQMVQALSELTRNAEAGQPFASALAVLETGLASEPAVKALSAVAKTGVPSTASVLNEFAAVHSALSAAAGAPAAKPSGESEAQSSSFLGSLQQRLSSVIKIRPSGSRDWAKLGDEMAALAGKGRLGEMVQLADNVSETPPEALAGWLKTAKSRLALDRDVSALSAKAMDHLAATSKTGG